MGMGDVEAAIVLEEIARVDVSSAIMCQLVFNGPPAPSSTSATRRCAQKWLPQAAAGELFCIGITEPDAGSAATAMRAHLTEDGDGWRLDAYKNYVTGGHRSVACLVWCRFPGGEPGTGKGIGAVLVDLARDGVSVAGTHRKMGLRGCTEAELAFDGVRIEPEDVLVAGVPGDNSGLKTLLAHINHERCGNAAMCVGAAQGALEYAMSYMVDRKSGVDAAGRPAGAAVEDRRRRGRARGRQVAAPAGPRARRTPRHSPAARVRHGQDRLQPGRQEVCATRPSSFSGATASAVSTRWSGPIATCGACASGRGRSRSSATSWAPPCWPERSRQGRGGRLLGHDRTLLDLR